MSKKGLLTPFGEGADLLWEEYPRPSLVRDSFIDLNGEWELKSGNGACKIRVPFSPESMLSGVELDVTEALEYKRRFLVPDGFNRGRILIHFGAVDTEARVYINGIEAGEHTGGYNAFFFDITEFVNIGENEITVRVLDTLDKELPYGKQSRRRGGMWYTKISGIWQSVFIESVPDEYIERLEITPSLDGILLKIVGNIADECEKTLEYEGGVVKFFGDSLSLAVENGEYWTPENPRLYEFTLTAGEDKVCSYFALRTVSTEGGRLLLNGKPYFFHGLLDQGYYSDGIYTPASSDGYKYDILLAKKLGFNMLRKHIKVEPDIFYYYCDKYGIAVFQDFVNSGKYNFFIDTVLPTVAFKRGISHKATPYRRKMFETCAEETVKALYNHPSVVYYTIFNEGWGQYDADKLYKKFKALDSTRIYDATSGWFFENESDVDSHHVYFKKLKLKKGERPLVLSEFGGYSVSIDGHRFNEKKTYGYKIFKTPKEFEDALVRLYEDEVVPLVRHGLSASVLTQLSDVEDETNGLVTYDRRVVKVTKDKMLHIRELINEAFDS